MSRSLFLAATSLLAALPSTLAQTPTAYSINTGPAVPSSSSASAAAAPGTTFSMLVAGVGNATTTAGGAAPAASSTGGVTNTWVIRVGGNNGSFTFSPNTITGAQVGDQVQFQFFPGNHAVAMGDYANPCQPVQNSQNAFFSGFMDTKAEGEMTFTVPVRSTEPMWLYCPQGRHCQQGMVGVVNPPANGETLADFQQRAAQAAQNVAPSAASGGQMASGTAPAGGAIGATPSGPTAPLGSASASTSGIAQSPNTAALSFEASSWSLGAVAAIAVFLL